MVTITDSLYSILTNGEVYKLTITGRSATTNLGKWGDVNGDASGAYMWIIRDDGDVIYVIDFDDTEFTNGETLELYDFSQDIFLTATLTTAVQINPTVRHLYGDHPTTHASEGLITILNSQLNSSERFSQHRTEKYRIMMQIDLDGQTDQLMLEEIVIFIEGKLDAINGSIVEPYYRDWFWMFNYSWNGLTRMGKIDAMIDVNKEWVNT